MLKNFGCMFQLENFMFVVIICDYIFLVVCFSFPGTMISFSYVKLWFYVSVMELWFHVSVMDHPVVCFSYGNYNNSILVAPFHFLVENKFIKFLSFSFIFQLVHFIHTNLFQRQSGNAIVESISVITLVLEFSCSISKFVHSSSP